MCDVLESQSEEAKPLKGCSLFREKHKCPDDYQGGEGLCS